MVSPGMTPFAIVGTSAALTLFNRLTRQPP
jgi:hypothetical protein